MQRYTSTSAAPPSRTVLPHLAGSAAHARGVLSPARRARPGLSAGRARDPVMEIVPNNLKLSLSLSLSPRGAPVSEPPGPTVICST